MKKKKGITKHHIVYGEKEVIVELPNKGSHLMLTAAQSMNPNKQNIKWLKNIRRGLDYIIKQKENEIPKK